MKNTRIEDIKNHTADTIEKVHAWTFTLFDIFVCILLDKVVLERFLPDSLWAEFIRAVAFAGGYYLIYLAIRFFLKVTTQSKHPFEGKWYHVHIPNDALAADQARIERLSAGITHVARNLNDFTFVANNYRYTVDADGNLLVRIRESLCREKEDEVFYRTDPKGNEIKVLADAVTEWHTETSELCDGNEWDLVEIYKATSEEQQTLTIHECPTCGRRYGTPKVVEEAPRSRYGIHLYSVKDNGNQLVCTYSDCWPSLKSGKLYMFRSRSDRDAKIKEFFREHPL